MKITLDKAEQYTLVKPEIEKLDSVVAPILKTQFLTLNAEGTRNFILDMASVKYSDSSGLSAVLTANRLCKDADGILVLCRVSEHVMKLIKISRLDTVLTILPTPEEAVDLIFMEEIEKDLGLSASDEE